MNRKVPIKRSLRLLKASRDLDVDKTARLIQEVHNSPDTSRKIPLLSVR